MKKVIRLIIVGVLASATLVSCKKDDNTSPAATTPTPVENILSGNLETQTLDATKKYTLKGLVYVRDGKTLTIPAGTIIFGDKASKASLIINRGGKIIANGTASNPIIFTSNAPAPYKNYGDWGGLVICGKAANNQGASFAIEGPTDFDVANGTDNGIYGGTVENDNSGSLQYVRFEFGGIVYSPDKEINGLTLGSVGSGTTIDHVQVSYSGDDAVEWFGGSVNCKYLVQYKTWDDDFDTDFGYRGNVQFGIAMRDKNIADQSLSNGFESDNDAAGSGKTPYTTAKFSNITIMGPRTFSQSAISSNYQAAMHIRRNTQISIQNSVITGFPMVGNLDKYQGVVATYVKNNVFAAWSNANARGLVYTVGNGSDSLGFGTANTFGAKNSVKLIFADTVLAHGNPVQVAGSAGLTGASFTDLTDPFFTSTTYKGAMGLTPDAGWDWSAGWLNFAPETKVY